MFAWCRVVSRPGVLPLAATASCERWMRVSMHARRCGACSVSWRSLTCASWQADHERSSAQGSACPRPYSRTGHAWSMSGSRVGLGTVASASASMAATVLPSRKSRWRSTQQFFDAAQRVADGSVQRLYR